MAYDQLVTNMGVHQKHSEKLVYWPKLELIWTMDWCFMVALRIYMFVGQAIAKKRCLNWKLAIARNRNVCFVFTDIRLASIF